jgi:hypothetical protein
LTGGRDVMSNTLSTRCFWICIGETEPWTAATTNAATAAAGDGQETTCPVDTSMVGQKTFQHLFLENKYKKSKKSFPGFSQKTKNWCYDTWYCYPPSQTQSTDVIMPKEKDKKLQPWQNVESCI